MKNKLLKLIRSSYKIHFYPNKLMFHVSGKLPNQEEYLYGGMVRWHANKQSCIDEILKFTRLIYQSRSRKYKIKNINKQVWP